MAQEGQSPSVQAPIAGEVYEARDVTRQALVVWQPPLGYQLLSAAGELDRRRYEIQVRVILTSKGEVAELQVRQPVSRDAMAVAAEMTRHAKFIPAELNGRPVSQRYTFKYTLGH